ncbi:hypothetical protein TNCV_1595881 [Trichonephila clavipes]|nr:hypothetical protein TNCV_1595881 [Trichonephila clavipes]
MANCPPVKEWPKSFGFDYYSSLVWISEYPSSRAQIGRTIILLIDLQVSPDPVCRMVTPSPPSVPGISFSILAMGQERERESVVIRYQY